MRPRLAAGQHRAVLRLHRDDLQPGLARLEHFRTTGHRTAGTHPGNDHINLAVGVVPDFLGGGLAVDRRIGRILELLQHFGIGIGGQNFLGLFDRPAHTFGRRRQFQLRAQQLEHFAPFDRHAFGHGQNKLIALGGTDKGQCDTGITGSRLHQHRIPGYLPGGFGGFHHRPGNAVLHRRQRVEKFQLGIDLRATVFFFGQPVDTHQRRVADRVQNAVIDAPASGGFCRILFNCRHGHNPSPSPVI